MASLNGVVEDGRRVTAVSGPIDSYTAPQISAALRQIDASEDLVVDLRECTYIDTAGLWVLRERSIAAEKAGGSMVVRSAPASIRRFFVETGFDRLVVVEDDAPPAYYAPPPGGHVPYRSGLESGG